MYESQVEGADPAPSLVDASKLRELPSSPRAIRMRERLVSAARIVFERDGYMDSKLSDITRQARCSIGSFYNYFSNKDEVLAAVLLEAQDDMLHPGPASSKVRFPTSPIASIEATNRAYLDSYRRNGRLMLLMDQVAGNDPRFRELRQRRAQVFIERNARYIANLRDEGLVDPDLDPFLTSRALSGMTSRLAFNTYALGKEADFEDLVFITTRLWSNALGITCAERGHVDPSARASDTSPAQDGQARRSDQQK